MISLVIPGKPIHQPRLRHFVRGGVSCSFNPASAERLRINEFLLKTHEGEKFNHPHLSFIFYFEIPKSFSKKKRLLYETEEVRHEAKPDVDNLIVFYMNRLDGIYFEGDQKVSLGPCYKFYGRAPRTEILIEEAT